MSILRKAMWPTAVVAGLLLFFGAIGTSTPTASAEPGDQYEICAIVGPTEVLVGTTFIVYAQTYDESNDDEGFTVTVDDGTGDGDIVGELDGTITDDLDTGVGPTDLVNAVPAVDPGDFTPGLNNTLDGYGGGFSFDEELCGDGLGVNGPNSVDDDDDDIVLVLIKCDEAGQFDVSFSDAVESENSLQLEITCVNGSKTATISANPLTVEIVPSFGSVAHSLIVVTLKDAGGNPSFPGEGVLFTTDRCSIETSQVVGSEDYAYVKGYFDKYNVLQPKYAADIENNDFATTPPDSNRQQDENVSFHPTASGTSTVSAAILHCDPVDAPGVTPGPAKVCAYVDVFDATSVDDDIIVCVTVTVVGPPVANGITVTAAPASLICGEKATISVDIKDAAGQPVSDHTLLEAITNYGGVLAGTGAVAGQAGLVSPISSTVAETFGGKATIYLLTSDAHTGKYEVVITTGGGGGVAYYGNPFADWHNYAYYLTNHLGGLFTTAPISVQVTVECGQPVVVAPAVTAPATGQGIKPPSTGDAGLASSESTSWTLIAGSAMAALVMAGFVLKTVRNEKN